MRFKDQVKNEFELLQDEICTGLEKLDGKANFHQDSWDREGGGGGRTRIIQDGDLLEKGGVNFSAVEGVLPESITNALGVDNNEFFASGVSIVLHPHSPHVPIIHMNVRYFELNDGTYWFGGGIDLTPHFIVDELAKDFHKSLKTTCDAHDLAFYDEFKVWADNYFFNQHRNETRGVGGIFYDRLNEEKSSLTKESLLEFSLSLGRTFCPAYEKQTIYRNSTVTPEEKRWQLIRRGRYVEFNLVYDRGTKFGLETAGRIESILMSLPNDASWIYNYAPTSKAEKETLEKLKKGINWLS
ncbi:oxygen-dependent coproporphyrinogen oxidase [Flavobacteriales bacterium]|nr:oxygen-dependent coproporphyrinogen oxidase [Flavobacteriales bacterium]